MAVAKVLEYPHSNAENALEDACWRGVLAKDGSLDGHFVYGVSSTGIYCRPSCPSRRPLRKNVTFFSSLEQAERAGFRACRRCEPRMFVESAAKRRLDEELRIATSIQQRLLPADAPRIAGWELDGVSLPCREVGGDYFDFIPRSGEPRLTLALGDVAGKGVSAALLMASVHAAIRTQGARRAPADVLREVNGYLCANTSDEQFLTLFYADLDTASGALEYANAGHNAPLLLREDGTVLRLEAGGPPLGLLPHSKLESARTALAAGDLLLVFSDGLCELENRAGEQFGEARIIHAARAARHASAARTRERILDAAWEFAGRAAQADDVSLVLVQRMPG